MWLRLPAADNNRQDAAATVGPASFPRVLLVSTALQQFGFPASSVPPSRFLAKGMIHVFGREPLRVDILADPSGVQFEDCFPRRVDATLDGVRVPFISLDDLRANKRASGRPKDLADVHELSGPPFSKPAAPTSKKLRPPRHK
jgi:hypothetical protein